MFSGESTNECILSPGSGRLSRRYWKTGWALAPFTSTCKHESASTYKQMSYALQAKVPLQAELKTLSCYIQSHIYLYSNYTSLALRKEHLGANTFCHRIEFLLLSAEDIDILFVALQVVATCVQESCLINIYLMGFYYYGPPRGVYNSIYPFIITIAII